MTLRQHDNQSQKKPSLVDGFFQSRESIATLKFIR